MPEEVKFIHLLYTAIGTLIPIVGLVAAFHRQFVRPAKEEREALIKWRERMEAKDRDHDANLERIEHQLARGERQFKKLLVEIRKLRDVVVEVRTKLDIRDC